MRFLDNGELLSLKEGQLLYLHSLFLGKKHPAKFIRIGEKSDDNLTFRIYLYSYYWKQEIDRIVIRKDNIYSDALYIPENEEDEATIIADILMYSNEE